MSRKRVCLTTSELDEGVKRKKKLDEKLASLCKKAYELSILCDVKVGIVSSIPEKTDVFAWPSLPEAQKIVNDHIAFPKHKVTMHNNFLQSIVEKREEEVRKLEETLEKMEIENLFNELFKGNKLLNEVNVGETKGLLKLIAVKRVQFEQRKIQVNEVAANNNVAEENVVGHA
ncbi:MADS-box transcription factor 56-like [Solanum tuberosum]|uniref:Type I MADS box transcription factor n=1 Tax=Solanum tuberosum TaxID=4113 RepID=M1DVD2_SOLTU|nr:PREDICTED: MADS-box transcription factor 56-like [Solanum tuberosum]